MMPMKEVSKKMKEKGIDTSKIPLEKAIRYYEEGSKLERKRLSTTQTSL
jgi:hypothetical protein